MTFLTFFLFFFLLTLIKKLVFNTKVGTKNFFSLNPLPSPDIKKVKVKWWQIRSTDYGKFLFKAEIASFTTNVMNLYLLAATGRKRCDVTTKHSIIWINCCHWLCKSYCKKRWLWIFLSLKSPEEWAITKQVSRDKSVVFFFLFFNIYIFRSTLTYRALCYGIIGTQIVDHKRHRRLKNKLETNYLNIPARQLAQCYYGLFKREWKKSQCYYKE